MANQRFSTLVRFFQIPELRKKFLIVLGLVVLSRLIATIPIPGVDKVQLSTFLNSNPAFSLLNIFPM